MYPSFALTARKEGFTKIAEIFEAILKAERYHAARFRFVFNFSYFYIYVILALSCSFLKMALFSNATAKFSGAA